jgi:hypothetical protein
MLIKVMFFKNVEMSVHVTVKYFRTYIATVWYYMGAAICDSNITQ